MFIYQRFEKHWSLETENSIIKMPEHTFIPFDMSNSFYAEFKKQITKGEAQILEIDGTTMTNEDALVYIATLP